MSFTYSEKLHYKFREAFGKETTNFITPTVLGYRSIPNGVAEISTGTGIGGVKLFGVTVVKDGRHRTELGKCLYSEQEAEQYLVTLNHSE